MSNDPHETSLMLPGMEPASSDGPVRQAYRTAVDALNGLGVLQPQHQGIVANLLRLAAIIDAERKGYAVAHATAQAHELMKSLLALVPVEERDDEWDELAREIQRAK